MGLAFRRVLESPRRLPIRAQRGKWIGKQLREDFVTNGESVESGSVNGVYLLKRDEIESHEWFKEETCRWQQETYGVIPMLITPNKCCLSALNEVIVWCFHQFNLHGR